VVGTGDTNTCRGLCTKNLIQNAAALNGRSMLVNVTP
jgi:hypothetical protein